jgi:Uma2 family endonuclease
MVAVDNLAQQLIERLKTEEFIRVPASEAEYLDIAPEFPGKLEYHNGEIIAMSLATALHELIVSAINRLLANYYFDKDFLVTSSNAGLQIVRPDGSYYQPDLMVTQGKWTFKKGSNCIITNPYLAVEVLSKSTSKYDQGDKMSDYKDVPSLQYIVHVWQNRPYVSVYERTENPDSWLITDYKTLDSVARLGDLTLPLNDIYHKITF